MNAKSPPYRADHVGSLLRAPFVTKAREQHFEKQQLSAQDLAAIEDEAIKFIEYAAKQFQQSVVAYSGGKDSLVTLDLVSKSDVPYEIIFANTGLEFPETLESQSTPKANRPDGV